MSFFNTILDFVPWVLGGGLLASIAGILALWFVAPHLMPVVGNVLQPVGKFLGETFVKFGNILVHGFMDIVDDGKTVITVLVLIIGLHSWFYYSTDQVHISKASIQTCKPVIDALRKAFRS